MPTHVTELNDGAIRQVCFVSSDVRWTQAHVTVFTLKLSRHLQADFALWHLHIIMSTKLSF